MKHRRLKTASLADALKGMKVGETCLPPANYSVQAVRARCWELKDYGYVFRTRTTTGEVLITRLK